MIAHEAFLEHLRDALDCLRDFDALRANPLCALLGVADRFDAPVALQQILVEAIESLEPDEDEPSQSRARRVYELLYYRYVQQSSQQEVAHQLGIGVRHVRREQHVAVEALAYRLWQQFRLEDQQREIQHEWSAEAELAWVRNAPAGEPTDLGVALATALELARPLAARHGIALDAALEKGLPGVAAHPVALNQLLLTLITLAIRQASAEAVRVSIEVLPNDLDVCVRAARRRGEPQVISGGGAASLDVVRLLTEACGGQLTLAESAAGLQMTLRLPVFEQVAVLALDDNADTLQLFERYTAGTRYRLYRTREPEQVMRLVEQVSPKVIVLDVMMPQTDGWRVLSQLREHPRTGHIPVIVCTILPQEELALTLGAYRFVQKPIRRLALLAALDQATQTVIGSD